MRRPREGGGPFLLRNMGSRLRGNDKRPGERQTTRANDNDPRERQRPAGTTNEAREQRTRRGSDERGAAKTIDGLFGDSLAADAGEAGLALAFQRTLSLRAPA